MAQKLPIWVFLTVALVVLGAALMPILRAALGIDERISMPFTTMVMLLIAGLMSGLTAMLLLVRRAPRLGVSQSTNSTPDFATEKTPRLALHACGLLLFSGIPLLNFLLAYGLWMHYRTRSPSLNAVGREVLDFQITLYLYLLLSLFLVFTVIGLLTTPLLLALHLIFTLAAITATLLDKPFRYPLSIPVTEGRAQSSANT